MIVHIVLFQPKGAVTAEQREAFSHALRQAVSRIPQIRRAQVGRAVEVGASYEPKLGHPPYEYVAILEFSSLDDLRTYLDHPLHARVGEMFWTACESTLILDAEMTDVTEEILEFGL